VQDPTPIPCNGFVIMLNSISWLAFAIGIATSLVVLVQRRSRIRELSWSQVNGIVIESKVELVYDNYRPKIRYEYFVHEARYVSETVRSNLVLYNWSGPAKRLCARYHLGANVRVFYNLRDPSQSVLEPGGDRLFSTVLMAISLILIVVIFGFING
jgi:hypothetical protein